MYLSFGDNRLLLDLDDEGMDKLRVEIRRTAHNSQRFCMSNCRLQNTRRFLGRTGKFIS